MVERTKDKEFQKKRPFAESEKTLILGGTSEARELAECWPADLPVIISYSGAYSAPPKLNIEMKIGGFGGVEGLKGFIESNHISRMIDATHPFARQMTQNAMAASKDLDVELMRLERPNWHEEAGDNWISVSSLDEAALKVNEREGPVLLTTGLKDIAPFQKIEHKALYLRCLETANVENIPPVFKIVKSSPPYFFETEVSLLKDLNIQVIVTKNSGGDQTFAKIKAARALKIPVIMIERPVMEGLHVYETVQDVLKALKRET